MLSTNVVLHLSRRDLDLVILHVAHVHNLHDMLHFFHGVLPTVVVNNIAIVAFL